MSRIFEVILAFLNLFTSVKTEGPEIILVTPTPTVIQETVKTGSASAKVEIKTNVNANGDNIVVEQKKIEVSNTGGEIDENLLKQMEDLWKTEINWP